MAERIYKTALVLAGDVSLGAAQTGLLETLARTGFTPELIVGSSLGAPNAKVLAGDPTQRRVADLAEIRRDLRRSYVFPRTLRSALGWLGPSDALFDAGDLRKQVERNLFYCNLENARIPVHIVAGPVMQLSGHTLHADMRMTGCGPHRGGFIFGGRA